MHCSQNSSHGKNLRGAGFTLIETLVAIAILSVSLTVIMQLFSGGLRSRKASDDFMQAIHYSRAKMEETLTAPELLEGVETGAFDEKYSWEVTIALELNDDEMDEDAVAKIPLERWRIDVNVSWQDGLKNKTYGISTLKILPKKKDDKDDAGNP